MTGSFEGGCQDKRLNSTSYRMTTELSWKGFERTTRYLVEVICRYLNGEIGRKIKKKNQSGRASFPAEMQTRPILMTSYQTFGQCFRDFTFGEVI